VELGDGKEDNVKEKRSIFRFFKKMVAKCRYAEVKPNKKKTLKTMFFEAGITNAEL